MIYFIVTTSTVQFGFLLVNLNEVQSLLPEVKRNDFGTALPTENKSEKLDIVMAMNVWNKLFDAVDESSIVHDLTNHIGSIPQKCLFTMFFHEVEPQIYEFLITVGILLIATILILAFFISTAIDFAVRRCFKVSGISLAV